MTADIYSYTWMLSLLLTFRQVFREPSGSFRNASFEGLTYGATYEEQLSTHFLDLLAMTCRQLWPRTRAALKTVPYGPVATNAM